jgi:hypothetical protein
MVAVTLTPTSRPGGRREPQLPTTALAGRPRGRVGAAARDGHAAPRERHGVRPRSGVIFFYFPDGIAGRSQNGEPSLWSASATRGRHRARRAARAALGARGRLRLPQRPLHGRHRRGEPPRRREEAPHRRWTAATASRSTSTSPAPSAATSPFRHLYLGAMATQNNASGDKFISYPSAGVTVAPRTTPSTPSAASSRARTGTADADRRRGRRLGRRGPRAPMGVDDGADGLALDTSIADLLELRAALGALRTGAGRRAPRRPPRGAGASVAHARRRRLRGDAGGRSRA